jgi:hypothetical protein
MILSFRMDVSAASKAHRQPSTDPQVNSRPGAWSASMWLVRLPVGRGTTASGEDVHPWQNGPLNDVSGGPADVREGRDLMADIVFVLLTVAVFVLLAAVVRSVEKL